MNLLLKLNSSKSNWNILHVRQEAPGHPKNQGMSWENRTVGNTKSQTTFMYHYQESMTVKILAYWDCWLYASNVYG